MAPKTRVNPDARTDGTGDATAGGDVGCTTGAGGGAGGCGRAVSDCTAAPIDRARPESGSVRLIGGVTPAPCIGNVGVTATSDAAGASSHVGKSVNGARKYVTTTDVPSTSRI